MKADLSTQKLTQKWLLAPLSAALLSSFVLMPFANARERGDHGNRGGANKMQAHKMNKPHKPNNDKRDDRANRIRDTSVNRVNINKDVNVNANVNVNRRGGGWDNDHHHHNRPLATALAVTATAIVVGSIVNSVPPNCAPYPYNGMIYQQCGNTWYQPQYMGTQVQYIVINRPY